MFNLAKLLVSNNTLIFKLIIMKEKLDQDSGFQESDSTGGNGSSSDIAGNSPSKLSECNVHFTNPFINDNFVDHMNKVSGLKAQRFETKKGLSLVTRDGETLSNDNNALVMHQRMVDKEEFTKIFSLAMKNVGISHQSSVLILYIAAKLNKDDTFINLHNDEICELMNISKATFYRALFDLIKHGVIARSKYSYKFYINPIFIFNGNRFTVVNQYIKSYGTNNQQGSLKDNNRNSLPYRKDQDDMTMHQLRNDHSDIDRARDQIYGTENNDDDLEAFKREMS